MYDIKRSRMNVIHKIRKEKKKRKKEMEEIRFKMDTLKRMQAVSIFNFVLFFPFSQYQ